MERVLLGVGYGCGDGLGLFVRLVFLKSDARSVAVTCVTPVVIQESIPYHCIAHFLE